MGNLYLLGKEWLSQTAVIDVRPDYKLSSFLHFIHNPQSILYHSLHRGDTIFTGLSRIRYAPR